VDKWRGDDVDRFVQTQRFVPSGGGLRAIAAQWKNDSEQMSKEGVHRAMGMIATYSGYANV